MSTTRKASLKIEKMGFWSIDCADCPLLPHLTALKQKPRSCTAGLSTNCQGAVPIAACEYFDKESIKIDGKGKKAIITFVCNHPTP
jgi:hypothetical protein